MTESKIITPAEPLVKTEPRDWYSEFKKSPMLWGYFCFENYFTLKPPDFHFEIINTAKKYPKLAVAVPRGFGKSVLLSFLYTFHAVYFKLKKFIVIVSNTEQKATEHVNAMKAEMMDNKLLTSHFGKLILSKDSVTDTVFKHRDDGFKTRILCKGVNQIPSIRGVRHGASRPDLILGDDIEDDEMVRSQDRRRQLREELDDVLKYAGSRGTQYIFIGTILHDDSQIANMVSKEHYQEYRKIFYQAADEVKRISIWPQIMTFKELMHLKETDPRSYAKEMQNDPVAGQNTRFTPQMFRRWREVGDKYELLDEEGRIIRTGAFSDCKGAIACDLAWEERKDADRAVILSGLLTPTSDILIYRYIAERGLRPDKFNSFLFQMVDRIEKLTGNRCPVGFEKAMLEKVVKWLLKQEMKKRNKFIVTKELSWEKDKIKRIEIQLEPRYTNNTIFHRSGMGALEHELLRFPFGVTDDIIDAEQGLCQLLQYPRSQKKEVESKTEFDIIRNLYLQQHYPRRFRKRYIFGRKSKGWTIPAKQTFR